MQTLQSFKQKTLSLITEIKKFDIEFQMAKLSEKIIHELGGGINIATSTDSYKIAHYKFFPSDLQYSQYYVTSRGGRFDKMFVDGLAAMVQKLEKGISKRHVKKAKQLFKKHFGTEIFNCDGWDIIASELGGKLPIRIRAVEEGTLVPSGNPVLVIENTDPRFGWLPGYLETFILRAVWYSTTVSTISFETKKIIREYMKKTVEDDRIADVEPSRLIDFGSRGVSSAESSGLGGSGHMKHFLGSDNVEALVHMEDLYGFGVESFIAGFSIPATEHSCTTIYGEDGEDVAFMNGINKFGAGLFAMVADSYDYENAVERLTTGKLKEAILEAGGTLIIRPDSGNPIDVVMIALRTIAKNVGFTTNSKGYRVLHDSYRVIQGDGVDLEEIRRILDYMESQGWSAENVAFGMGGGLLQQLDRDWGRWAMKACCAVVGGKFVEVFKCPKTDMSKASKKGYLDLIRNSKGELETIHFDEFGKIHKDSILNVIFEDGKSTWKFSLERSRELSDQQAG